MNELTAQDQALLNDLLDGRLAPDAAGALRARIEQEAPLAEAWRELQQLRDWGRSYADATAGLEAPEELAERIRSVTRSDAARTALATADSGSAESASSEAASPKAVPRNGRLLRMLAISYAAAALLVVGFTVRWVLVGPGDAEESDVESALYEEEQEAGTTSSERGKSMESTWADEAGGAAAKDSSPGESQGDSSLKAGRRGKRDDLSEAEAERALELARIREEEKRRRADGGGMPSSGTGGTGGSGGKKVGHFGPGDSVRPRLRAPRDAGESEGGGGASPAGAPLEGKAKAEGRPAPKSLAGRQGEKLPGGVADAPSPLAGRSGRSRPEPQSIGLGGGFASKPRAPRSAPEAKKQGRKSAPATPADRLRLRLAAARDAKEQLFVLEVDDAQAGMKTARRLLDQALVIDPASDKRAQGPRFYRTTASSLTKGRPPPAKRRAGFELGEAPQSAAPHYVGSVGRSLDARALRRLLQQATSGSAKEADTPTSTPSGPAAPPPPASAPQPVAAERTPVRILVLERR